MTMISFECKWCIVVATVFNTLVKVACGATYIFSIAIYDP